MEVYATEDHTAAIPARVHEAALSVNCPACWAIPGKECTISGPPGLHLGRYARAARKGIILPAERDAVLAAAPLVFKDTTVILIGAAS